MEPWAATNKKQLRLVWRCYQFLSGFLANAHFLWVSHQSRLSLLLRVIMRWSRGLCTDLLSFKSNMKQEMTLEELVKQTFICIPYIHYINTWIIFFMFVVRRRACYVLCKPSRHLGKGLSALTAWDLRTSFPPPPHTTVCDTQRHLPWSRQHPSAVEGDHSPLKVNIPLKRCHSYPFLLSSNFRNALEALKIHLCVKINFWSLDIRVVYVCVTFADVSTDPLPWIYTRDEFPPWLNYRNSYC